MSFSLRFTVPGDPVPKARHRVGRYGKTYTPQRTVDYELSVGWQAGIAMNKAGIAPLNDGESRFAVTLDLYMATERRMDLDNCIKSVLDGLTPRKPRGRARGIGLFWKDDSQVDIIAAQKAIAGTMKCQPCAIVTVRML